MISGIGKRPAVTTYVNGLWVHNGFRCLAPRLTQALLKPVEEEFERALSIREKFIPVCEDLRDAWGPARVLHHATELWYRCYRPIARTPPLSQQQIEELAPVARALMSDQL